MKKKLAFLPNALSFLNLCCGFFAISSVIRGSGEGRTVLCLIFLGGIFDGFDGFLARKLGAESDFGKQLDSFADLLTFGMAPMVWVVGAVGEEMFNFTLAASLIYVMAGIFRLTRYNVEPASKMIKGLPITAAGVFLTLFHYASYIRRDEEHFFTPIIMLGLAVLMVADTQWLRKMGVGS